MAFAAHSNHHGRLVFFMWEVDGTGSNFAQLSNPVPSELRALGELLKFG
jgi:hypothetical protein